MTTKYPIFFKIANFLIKNTTQYQPFYDFFKYQKYQTSIKYQIREKGPNQKCDVPNAFKKHHIRRIWYRKKCHTGSPGGCQQEEEQHKLYRVLQRERVEQHPSNVLQRLRRGRPSPVGGRRPQPQGQLRPKGQGRQRETAIIEKGQKGH